MVSELNHVYVVTHTDLDGVGSAAVALRILRRRPGRDSTIIFTEPYELHEVLGSIEGYLEKGDMLIVADLGLNEDTRKPVIEIVRRLTSKGVLVEWYDHHVWDPDDISTLSKLGVRINIDRTTCATGVVAKYMAVDNDSFLAELVDAVCSADLWRWSNSLSPKLFRAVGSREASNEWRVRVLEKFLDGILWDEELERKLEAYVNEELRNVKEILRTKYIVEEEGLRIAVAYKENGPPANSIIGALLTSRYKADIAVIVRPNGGISLRSRRVNVQRIASRLGGGGHPRAAGAKIPIPLWVRILKPLTPRIITFYVARLIARCVRGNVELLEEPVGNDDLSIPKY